MNDGHGLGQLLFGVPVDGVAALVESRWEEEEENRCTTPFMEIDGGIELVLCQLPRCLLLEQQLGILQR